MIVWADQTTRVHGQISANAGMAGGNGDLIETSGKQFVDHLFKPVRSEETQAPG